MTGLLIALFALMVLLLAALAIPVDLVLAAYVNPPDEALRKEMRLRWLFGLVDVRLGNSQTKPSPTAPKPCPPSRKTRMKSSTRFRIRRLLTRSAFWKWLRLVLNRLFRTVHWRVLRLEARLGLDDPADTGRLWGILGPLVATLPPDRSNVSIHPVFDGPLLALDSAIEVRLIPLQLLWVILSLALLPSTWRALWPALAAR